MGEAQIGSAFIVAEKRHCVGSEAYTLNSVMQQGSRHADSALHPLYYRRHKHRASVQILRSHHVWSCEALLNAIHEVQRDAMQCSGHAQ